MAVSAHVITMGIENDMNGNIKAWFKQFNFLPPIPLTAAQVDTISHDLSFEHLLELVLQSTYTNFILIIHGQPDGSGLYLPLFAIRASTAPSTMTCRSSWMSTPMCRA